MSKIAVVFQTHWDREWYFSLDTFNFRLLKVMDRILALLDEKVLETFVLDGQVKMIEDYFEICSEENLIKVKDYIKQGKLIIGPWYVLADEFLVQGESLFRNLELGIQTALHWGEYQKLGYLPDTFGHISQMPQILQHFNIDKALVWRGVHLDEPTFMWQSPDGSKVHTVFLKTGYYQPILDQENPVKLLETWLSQQPSHPEGVPFLLTNGGDHLMPSEGNLKERMKHLNNETTYEFYFETYESYIEKYLKESPKIMLEGELRNNENAYILPNVLSSRIPLKQLNQQLENSLTMRLEPLIALAYPDQPYPAQVYLDSAWKRLLENHPHDSICGCSIDEVHREMMTRSQKISDQIKAIEADLTVQLGLTENTRNFSQHKTPIFSDESIFSVYNPTPYVRHGYHQVSLFLEASNPLNDGFIVADMEGKLTYTTIIIEKKPERFFASPLDQMPGFRQGTRYEVLFKVNHLEGFGLRSYQLKPGQSQSLLQSSSEVIANDRFKIRKDKQEFIVSDLLHGTEYPMVHQLYSSLDAGDEYNYSQPIQDSISTANITDIEVFTHDLIQRMVVHYEMHVPQSLNSDRSSASLSTVVNTFKTIHTLVHGQPFIDTQLTLTNKAKDHRIRLRFELPNFNHHYSDTAFDLVKRAVRKESFEAPKGKEVEPVVDPSLSMLQTSNGFVFYHQGLHEYQAYEDGIEITLLRSVGSLSRDDLRSRGGGAGPSFETPDAQLLGQHEYRYRWTFHSEANAAESQYFRNSLRVYKGKIASPKYLFELNNPLIGLSSIRKWEKGIDVRVFNPTSQSQSFAPRTARKIKSVQTIDGLTNSTPANKLFCVEPKAIQTYRFEWASEQIESTDVFIAGGSIGGVIAASTLLQAGHRVIMVESTDWVGGQLTSQAVPLDEHPFIETFGSTRTYRAFRQKVRDYYREKYSLDSLSETLNPGNAWVTRLAFEPRVAHAFFKEMLQHENLVLKLRSNVVSSQYSTDSVHSVVVKDKESGNLTQITAKFFLDATDTGELLPLTGTDYTVGAEAKFQTQEPHAKDKEDVKDMQPITYVASLIWDETAQGTIDKPQSYETFKAMKMPYDEFSILSSYGPDSSTGKARKFNIIMPPAPLWSYRRFFDPKTLGVPQEKEKTLLNWPQNDYFMGNIIDDENASEHLMLAKELTLCLLYYLQTEIPHSEGQGYRQIQLDTSSLGTEDGLAMAPYIRESRRIKALQTIVEQDVSAHTNATLPKVQHSVGVGCYHIDLHITTSSHTFFYDQTWPFEIPLKALIPIEKLNLLPACKNIGTTHLTNGCFRLHPVEWNIGESVGYLVDYCLKHQINPHELLESPVHLKAFLGSLDAAGIERHWPEEKVHVI